MIRLEWVLLVLLTPYNFIILLKSVSVFFPFYSIELKRNKRFEWKNIIIGGNSNKFKNGNCFRSNPTISVWNEYNRKCERIRYHAIKWIWNISRILTRTQDVFERVWWKTDFRSRLLIRKWTAVEVILILEFFSSNKPHQINKTCLFHSYQNQLNWKRNKKIIDFSPLRRYFADYRQLNCKLECRLAFIERTCHCLPYYYSMFSTTAKICTFTDIKCLVDEYCNLIIQRWWLHGSFFVCFFNWKEKNIIELCSLSNSFQFDNFVLKIAFIFQVLTKLQIVSFYLGPTLNREQNSTCDCMSNCVDIHYQATLTRTPLVATNYTVTDL